MILTVFKYSIYEKCIDIVFHEIYNNFIRPTNINRSIINTIYKKLVGKRRIKSINTSNISGNYIINIYEQKTQPIEMIKMDIGINKVNNNND